MDDLPALPLSRRDFLRASGLVAAASALRVPPAEAAAGSTPAAQPPPPVEDLGTRLELFVDDTLIERLSGKAELRLHHPQPQEVALVHDAPWEGGGSGYHNVFRDGDLYRMYYRGWKLDGTRPGFNAQSDIHYCCYAESNDGVHWRKPELGLFAFNGSKANNIVIPSGRWGHLDISAGEASVFKDQNPDAPADARYKALIFAHHPFGLVAFKSADAIHWSPMADRPVITAGSFDSQNLAFWDAPRGEYRAYWRFFTKGITDETHWQIGGAREIRTATSKDFIHWSAPRDLAYVDSPEEQLYTNVVKPYPRAPHILIGFPTRYTEREWSDSMRALPQLAYRENRARKNLRYGAAITEALLMASRDGTRFKRWNEAFLRPGIERDGTWNYGNQYIAWYPVETKSSLTGGAPGEFSLYAVENYWSATGSALRRYTLRIDGFVSAQAPMSGGELLTRPLTFGGRRLVLNFSSSAAGGLKVEIQDQGGRPLPGFALDDCREVFGDSLARTVTWINGGDLSPLRGRPVRLRFALKDADVFSLQFPA